MRVSRQTYASHWTETHIFLISTKIRCWGRGTPSSRTFTQGGGRVNAAGHFLTQCFRLLSAASSAHVCIRGRFWNLVLLDAPHTLSQTHNFGKTDMTMYEDASCMCTSGVVPFFRHNHVSSNIPKYCFRLCLIKNPKRGRWFGILLHSFSGTSTDILLYVRRNLRWWFRVNFAEFLQDPF